MKDISFTLESVNISAVVGTAKQPVTQALVRKDFGLEGDAHAGNWHRQVSLLSIELIEEFSRGRRAMKPGEFAENLTTRELDHNKAAIFDRLTIGEVELEITQIGKECHTDCAIMQEAGACIMPKSGLFARVLQGGLVASGMLGVLHQRPLAFRIITLSDRAARGEYEDRSGPKIEQLIKEFYLSSREHLEVMRRLIPDEPELLREELLQAADVIITTGSTGIGPRDIAPEVTAALCDKLIPGIMEHVRIKYGSGKSGALLSRGVAGVKNNVIMINFPGSVRAAEEYAREFLPLVAHMRRMLYGVDYH